MDRAEESAKLWGGRFTGKVDPLMMQYNASISYDSNFWAEDIAGSIAYARANTKTGILTKTEFQAIEQGLRQVGEEWQSKQFVINPEIDEDIHTANERRLGEIIGKTIAGKLHTGRSRNDQVATDMRLWLSQKMRDLASLLKDFLHVIASRSAAESQLIMPGYTHLQRAQPIRWAHWLLSYGFAFGDDLQRLEQVLARTNRSPLGCGALAGNPFNIDRNAMAKELGFTGLLYNSMNAVGDRDFVVEYLQWAEMFMCHVSRWAEDLIVYSTAEFGFVTLADAYSTGSSLMPQKKNPDSLELLRGKSGRAFGQMAGLMMSVKGIPSTYNKDLQESVEPMIDNVKTVGDSLRIATGVLSTMQTHKDRMMNALTPDMLATDVADYLVRKGVPFRESHHISGKVVAFAESKAVPMNTLTYEQLKAIDERFDPDIQASFNYEASVEQRSAIGGTSLSSVRHQIELLEGLIRSAS